MYDFRVLNTYLALCRADSVVIGNQEGFQQQGRQVRVVFLLGIG